VSKVQECVSDDGQLFIVLRINFLTRGNHEGGGGVFRRQGISEIVDFGAGEKRFFDMDV